MTRRKAPQQERLEDELHKLKGTCQNLLRDRFLCWVGSGLSAAQGLPTMPELARTLADRIPLSDLSADCRTAWSAVLPDLETLGLEEALLRRLIPEELEQAIVSITAQTVEERERERLCRLANEPSALPLGRLLKAVLTSTRTLTLVTTNYDRLAEAAIEGCGISCDALFVGCLFGRLDPRTSSSPFFTISTAKGTGRRQIRPLVRVIKPHGSLDWYEFQGDPVRSSVPLPGRRLIVTPGLGKFRKGYEATFNAHQRELQNSVERARGFLILGYGFNDEHLEACLRKQLGAGKPALYLTRSLSTPAATLLRKYRNILALSSEGTGTRVQGQGFDLLLPGSKLWDLAQFVREVCEP